MNFQSEFENLTEFLDSTNTTTETSLAFTTPRLPKENSAKPELYQIPPIGVNILYFAYGTICATALIGNSLGLWLILGARKLWSVTNIFLVNLAVGDVVISLFTIPFHFQAALLQRWDLPEFLCPLCPYVQAVSVLVSVLTLSFIALKRYNGVMKPFLEKASKKVAILQIIFIWVISVFVSLPTYLDYSVIYYHYQNRTVITPSCEPRWLSRDFRFYYTQFLVLAQYLVPLIILSFAYSRMGVFVWKSETPGNQDMQRDIVLQNRKRKATNMMAGIVVLFAVCWLPYQLYNLILPYYPEVNDFRFINVVWFSIHWLAMSNSSCNPFLYAIYPGNFRQEFKRRLDFWGNWKANLRLTRPAVQQGEMCELNEL